MKVIFIEKLNFTSILYLLAFKLKNKIEIKNLKIFFFNNNNFFANYLLKLIFKSDKCNKIRFNFDNLKDDKNITINYKSEHFVHKVLEKIFDNNNFKIIDKEIDSINSFALFFIKKVCLGKWAQTNNSLNNFLVNLYVCQKKMKDIQITESAIYLTSINDYIDELNKFSNVLGLEVKTINKYKFNFIINNLKNIKYNYIVLKIYIIFQRLFNLNKNFSSLKKIKELNNQNITIESDFDHLKIFYFWKIQNFINKKNLLFVSRRFSSNLNQILNRNKLHGINYFKFTNKLIKKKNECEIYFNYRKKNNYNFKSKKNIYNLINLKNEFEKEKLFWLSYFKKSNTKIYCTDEIWSYHSVCAISALHQLGGISCVIQTSYPAAQGNLVPYGMTNSDVLFCMTKKIMHDRTKLNFNNSYLVTTGYPLDYQINIIDNNLLEEKKLLISNGAKKIISYFDISFTTGKDARWTSSEVIINDYKFLLQKLLENKWLGLIFKPKKSLNFLNNISGIRDLFEKAIKTNRIFIDLKKKNLYQSVSKISDLSIHASLNGSTSGYESSFYNKPTFYLDRDNWKVSDLNMLGENKVIFTSMNKLWSVLQLNWEGSINDNISSWTKYKKHLDNFNDGKSNERVIDFLNYLSKNLKDCSEKKSALELTIKEYKEKWGSELVYKINKKKGEINFPEVFKSQYEI